MLWRLVVAAVSLLGFLGGATVLSAQFEKEVNAGYGIGALGNTPDLSATPPNGVKPIELQNIQLPAGEKLSIPPGAFLNPNGTISLPPNTTLPLSNALLNNVNLTLPRDGQLALPNGTTFDGTSLHFPAGANSTVSIPNVGKYTLPGGSTLKLPPDLAQQMLANGYSKGILNGAPPLRVPQGTTLSLPQLSSPTGSIQTGAGTTLVPPALSTFGLSPGPIPSGTSLNLPPGTSIQNLGALGAVAGLAYAANAGLTPGELPPALNATAPSDTNAQPVQVNSQVPGGTPQKGVPFYVNGYDRTLSGVGLAGVKVVVFVNQSQDSQGSALGSTLTDSNGNFKVQVTLPSDLPSGSYIIIAYCEPTRVGNVTYAGGWG
jgi:hypothetical protein